MKLRDIIDVLLLMRVISVTLARSSPPTLTVNPSQGDEAWIPLPINNATSGVDLEDVHVYQTPFTSPPEPAASQKELVVHQTSDLWGIHLTCSHFPRLGHPNVSIIWTMPNNKTKKNTTSDDGTCTLDLPYPVDSGTYTCSVRDRTSPAAQSSTGHKGSALSAAVIVQSKFDKKSILKMRVCIGDNYWIPLSPGIAVAEYYLGDVEIYQKKSGSSGKLVASVSNGNFSTSSSHVTVEYIPNRGFVFTAGMWDNGTLAIVGKSGHLKGSVTMASINVSKCIQTYGCVGDDVHFLHTLNIAKNVEIFFQPKEAKKTLVATYDNDIFSTVAGRNRLESGGGGIFTLVNATLADSGTYELHYDLNGQRTSFPFPLTVSDCHRHEASGYVGDNMHIPLDLRNLSAQCCPQLEIYFQNNAGKIKLVANYVNRIVSPFRGSKLEFTLDEGIRIFNLTLADSGIYTVVAKESQQKSYLLAKISVQVIVQSKFELKMGVCLGDKYWIPLSTGNAVAEYYLGDVEIYQKKSGKLVASVSNGTFSTYYSHVTVQYIPNSGFLFTAGMRDNGTLAIVGKSGHLKGSVTMASINVSKCIQTYGCVGDDVHFLHPLKIAKNVEIFFQPKEAKKTLVATYDNDIFSTVARRNILESGGNSIFTVVNATLADSGTYEFHYDLNGQRTSFPYPLTVSDCHRHEASGYVGDNMHIPLDLRNLSAQCCPQLEIYFQNNALGRRELVANYVNRIVSTFQDSRPKLEFTPDEGIRIFNLTLADSGIYTVVAKGSQQKIYLFAKISVQVRERSDALKKSKQG